MSDAGKTCVAVMVSAPSAAAEHTRPIAAIVQRIPFILPLRLSAKRGASYHRPVTTVFTAFEQTARAHRAKPFLQVFPEKVELSYAQALDRVASIAQIYARRGYGRGHRVALKLPNCAEFLLHFLALNSIAVSVVPLNPEYQRVELEHVLAHSEAALVVDRAALADFDPPPAVRPASRRVACSATSTSLMWGSATSPKAAFARCAWARSG